MLDSRARRLDGGRVLLGGSPLGLMRLSPGGAALLDELAAGVPVPSSGQAQALARRLLDAGAAHPRPTPALGPDQVTVVIPTRDRSAGLARTLAALGPVAAVVVVDDGSIETEATATAAVVARTARPATGGEMVLLRHPSPLGPAAARNTGWRRATTPVVAFLDADCEPGPGWLAALLPHLGDACVAAVAPRVVAGPPSTEGRLAGVLTRYEAHRSPLDLGPGPAPVRPRTRVSYVPSAALVGRRTALEALGGFDERLRVGEDVDLVWRLAEAGWTVRYEPAALVTHPCRAGLGPWLGQRLAYGRSAAPLARRHPGSVPPAACSAWSALSWALAGSGHPVAGAGLGTVTAALLGRRLATLDHPWREAARLAGLGHLLAGRQLAGAMVRAWWPLALGLALVNPTARRAVAAGAVVPPLLEWRGRRPDVGPLAWLALWLADDVAYGTGLWAGCLAERTLTPLAPDLSNWPGRQPAIQGDPGGTAPRGLTSWRGATPTDKCGARAQEPR